MTTLAETYDDLEGFLIDGEPEPEWDAPPPPAADDEQANRWLRRIARIDAERDRLEEVATAEQQRIRDWFLERLQPLEKQREWLVDSCGQYLAARIAAGHDTKSLHLPAGTVKATAQQPAYEWEDEEAFTAWAERHVPHAVRTTTHIAVDKTAAKRLLIVPALDVGETAPPVTQDGEIVPGVTVTRRGDRYSVTIEGGDA